jgi:hypothetical protein
MCSDDEGEIGMTTRTRAEQVMKVFLREPKFSKRNEIYSLAYALREAVEGLNIEPDPDRELSIEKHHFIRGQNWVKDAILRLAEEIDLMEQE